MSRSKKSLKNLSTALIGQAIGLIISFFARIVFLKVLNSEYLGLNGLFSNILSILSLAELGVGEAITFSLYKPLANCDIEKCKSLMQFYKKTYIIIGVIIMALGCLVTPFLPFLIKDMPDLDNINLIYILFVVNTAVSYFFSYKRNLIIADQNRYIVTIYRYAFYFIVNVLQIIYLLIIKDYIGFLIIQIICTILENIFVSKKANMKYPYLLDKEKMKLDSLTRNEIVKNTKAMLMHKIGGVIVNATDNILLSSIVGIGSVGLYSNYYLIINALGIIYGQFFSSIMASVGNLCALEGKKKQYDTYKKIDFIGYWIYSFSTVCLVCLLNPFIELWLGAEYLFGIDIVLIIVVNFYITGVRKTNLTFREATGLFYKGRWCPLFESFINLITSVILGAKFGTFGIFAGTFISSITTCVWVEPYLLYKYAFKKDVWQYFKSYISRIVLTIISSCICLYLCSIIEGNLFVMSLIKLFICIVIPNLLIIVIYRNNPEMKYIKKIVCDKITKILKK